MLFLALCNLFNVDAQCEPNAEGKYFVVFRNKPEPDDFPLTQTERYTNENGYVIDEQVYFDVYCKNCDYSNPNIGHYGYIYSHAEHASPETPPGTKLYRSNGFVHDVSHYASQPVSTLDALDQATAYMTNYYGSETGNCSEPYDDEFPYGFCAGLGFTTYHTEYLIHPDGESSTYINADDMYVEKIVYYNALDNTFKDVYTQADGVIETAICCLYDIEPTAYFGDKNLDTGSNDDLIWNADDPFDFTKAFKFENLDGNLLPEEDVAKVKWYVEDRSKQGDERFIYIDPNAPYNTPTAYYFNGEKNVDQWGSVEIKAEYTCGEDDEILTVYSNVEIIDIGTYFRNSSGDIIRWNKGVYDKYPAAYNGFYDPSKDIVMHSHGWQPGANSRHKANPVANPERERLASDGIQDWHGNYNVALFFWTQSAEHLNGVTPTLLNFLNPAARPIQDNPKWVRENGSETRVGIESDPLGSVCASQIDEILTTTGFNYASKEVRLVGHSFGAIMMTKTSEVLGTSKIDRLTWLDPATTPAFLTYYRDNIMPNPSILPPVEWYQSSAYDYAWVPFSAFVSDPRWDVYNWMISKTTYVRLDPIWEPGYPTGDGLLHGSAREHYYKSLTEAQPKIVKSVESTPSGFFDFTCPDDTIKSQRIMNWVAGNSITPLFNRCFEIDGPRNGPSAAASLDDLAFYKGRVLEQVWGTTTVSVADDRYSLRHADNQGNQIGQSYEEVDLSIQVQNNVDNVVITWSTTAASVRSSTTKNAQGKAATPNYYLIVDKDFKVIGYSSGNTYTVQGLIPETNYEFYVLPVGSDGYPTGYDRVSAETTAYTAIWTGGAANFQPDKKTWHKVEFSSPMYQPSVVMGPVSSTDAEPVTVRVRNVTNNGFEYQFDEWNYQDGERFYYETVHWMAVSKDVPNLAGIPLRSGTIDKVNHNYKEVTFSSEFSEKPIVFTQTTSFNGGAAVVTRVKDVTTTGFKVRVQEEEKEDDLHAKESVSYIAFTPGEHVLPSGTKIVIGREMVRHEIKGINLSGFDDSYSYLIAGTQTVNGGDPISLRYNTFNKDLVELRVEEEQSFDPEIKHAYEEVGYLIYGMEATENASRASKITNTDTAFKLFPNPTTGKIFLNSKIIIKKATVLDIHGRVLLDIDIMNKNQEIDVSGLKTGMYMLQIVTDQNEQRSLTFIKS
ncbi:hypothetical protein GCM10022259_35130 [Aquimarina mytili]